MEFVQWRRVNGIFCAFVEDIMCVCCRLVLACGHGIEHAGDACVAVIGFALYGYDKSLNVQNGIAHLFHLEHLIYPLEHALHRPSLTEHPHIPCRASANPYSIPTLPPFPSLSHSSERARRNPPSVRASQIGSPPTSPSYSPQQHS